MQVFYRKSNSTNVVIIFTNKYSKTTLNFNIFCYICNQVNNNYDYTKS